MCWMRRTCWASLGLGRAATSLSQVVQKTSYRNVSSPSTHARRYGRASRSRIVPPPLVNQYRAQAVESLTALMEGNGYLGRQLGILPFHCADFNGGRTHTREARS